MKAANAEMKEPPAEHKPETRVFFLILAVISLLMVHIAFSGIIQPLKTTPRLWMQYSEESAEITQITSGEEMSVAASQNQLNENVKIEQRFLELAQREAKMQEEIQKLKAENKMLAENLDTALFDTKRAQKLFLHDLYPAHETIAALRNVFDTMTNMRTDLHKFCDSDNANLTDAEHETRALEAKLGECTDELTLVNAMVTVAAFKQFKDPDTRHEYFSKKPSTIDLIDRLVDVPNLCCEHLQECQSARIEAGEADSVVETDFALQAYKDCRYLSDTLKWNLVLYEANEKFGSARNGPWSQEAWAYVMATMNENELENYDLLLLSHRPFSFDYSAASSRLPPSYDYNNQYDYSFEDYSYDYSYDQEQYLSYDEYDYEDDGVAR